MGILARHPRELEVSVLLVGVAVAAVQGNIHDICPVVAGGTSQQGQEGAPNVLEVPGVVVPEDDDRADRENIENQHQEQDHIHHVGYA
eukprot:2789928-Pyramimonas_sp.AAC.1